MKKFLSLLAALLLASTTLVADAAPRHKAGGKVHTLKAAKAGKAAPAAKSGAHLKKHKRTKKVRALRRH